MLRVLVMVVVLAGCGQKTVPPVMGTSQANAIAVPLTFDASLLIPQSTGAVQPGPVSRGLRWFAVTLPANEKHTLSISLSYRGSARSVDIELLDASGRVIAAGDAGTHSPYDRFGSRDIWLPEARGAYFIRVTAHDGAERYGFDISSKVVTPKPKEWAPCNPFSYEPENPRCHDIVACDPNKPETTNPSCCEVRCMRGECTGTVTRTTEEGYAWFSLGANAGITTWYDGFAVVNLVGGIEKSVRIKVVEVEPTRSKVLVSGYSTLDLSRFDGRLARLQTPATCRKD